MDTDTAGSSDTICHSPELCPLEPLCLKPQCILVIKEDVLPLFFFFVIPFFKLQQNNTSRTSLVVQQLKLLASNIGDVASIPGWGTKSPHAVRCGQISKYTLIINKHSASDSKQKIILPYTVKHFIYLSLFFLSFFSYFVVQSLSHV